MEVLVMELSRKKTTEDERHWKLKDLRMRRERERGE